ncbi:GAF domain-containing protein [Nocardioides bruguierae]|uniref:GAF domain-containing protein n=1 Tax=Nocardioides bruguierae TaxID=2945102 RepID=UPI002021B119|nr:GAF domain-containing protein [Nocardioides bruguierae]MCL8024700.1 hypothetical protein [Nocardioides bruguierae]
MDDGVPQRARLHADLAGAAARPAPRLVASWQRSESYGVPLEDVPPVFTGASDAESLFTECGRRVLADLAHTLADQPVSLMLTDAAGLVLDRVSGDHGLLRALDKVHLAPGFTYAEQDVGTNGLGLALADRVPTVVRAEEHYALTLCTYTCAAVPVLDPLTGRLEGSVNLTTWASSPADLLLALARSAASTTSAMMLARGAGQRPRPTPRGEVFRVEAPRVVDPGAPDLGEAWSRALTTATDALRGGDVVAVVGEQGTGRGTLVAQAARAVSPRTRVLAASAPDPADAQQWLDLWTPELGKPDTAVVVRDVDRLPTWVAERLRDLVVRARVAGGAPSVPVGLTAARLEDVPAPLAGLVGSVAPLPPLRERPDDVLPLVRRVAASARGRPVEVTGAAERALREHAWPGNVTELVTAVRAAVGRADVVDVAALPAEVLSGSGHRLTRIEAFERDEIVRVLSRPGVTMREAGEELGMSRATVYRKVAQYGIHVPRA